MTKRIKSETGFYTEPFKDWIGSLYMQGYTASQIRDIAINKYPGQLTGLTRNAVIGIVFRSGYMRERMQDRCPTVHNGMETAAMISLTGPEWSMPDRPDVRRVAA